MASVPPHLRRTTPRDPRLTSSPRATTPLVTRPPTTPRNCRPCDSLGGASTTAPQPHLDPPEARPTRTPTLKRSGPARNPLAAKPYGTSPQTRLRDTSQPTQHVPSPPPSPRHSLTRSTEEPPTPTMNVHTAPPGGLDHASPQRPDRHFIAPLTVTHRSPMSCTTATCVREAECTDCPYTMFNSGMNGRVGADDAGDTGLLRERGQIRLRTAYRSASAVIGEAGASSVGSIMVERPVEMMSFGRSLMVV